MGGVKNRLSDHEFVSKIVSVNCILRVKYAESL